MTSKEPANHTRRWRLPRLRWPTWVVLAVVVLAEVLIAVPGEPMVGYVRSDGAWRDNRSRAIAESVEAKYASLAEVSRKRVVVDQYAHGWPLPCLTRGIGRVMQQTPKPAGGAGGARPTQPLIAGHPRTKPVWSIWAPSEGESLTPSQGVHPQLVGLAQAEATSSPLSWSDYNRWPIATDVAQWRLGPLLVNLLALLAIAAIAAGATEWWVRSRGGVRRFRLIDLGVAFVALSLLLAWRQSHAALRRVEQRVTPRAYVTLLPAAALRRHWVGSLRGEPSFNRYLQSYQGPDWMRRLAGNQAAVRFCCHLTAIELVPNESWEHSIDALPRLKRLEVVSLPGGATPRALRALRDLPRLRHVLIGVDPPDGASPPPTGPPPPPAGQRWLTAQDLRLLHGLSLERIDLSGESIRIERLEPLARMPGLKKLELIEASVTAEEIERLERANPGVEITCPGVIGVQSTSSPRIQYRFEERF